LLDEADARDLPAGLPAVAYPAGDTSGRGR
jgi:hypothetical protein